MGIIINQSFKNMITTYAGFAIGAVNTLFLFTYFLEKEYYGLVSFLLSAANLVWPFMAFGVQNTLIKFYTSYKTEKEQQKLLNLVLILPVAVSIFIGLLGILGYHELLNYFDAGNKLVKPYVWLIFVIAFATAYFEVFFSWSKIKFKSVFGNFMKEVFQRLCVTILLVCVYLKWINVEQFIYATAGVFVFRALSMQLYAFSLLKPDFGIKMPQNLVTILKYSFLIFIAGSVATILLDLDKVMIEHYLPIGNVAVYGIAVYIATVIAVPQKALHQIIHPHTANLLNNRDKGKLEDIYKRSSISLLVVSGLIFILIMVNINELYKLMPPEYQVSTVIVLLISLVKLYDNMLGNNNSILFNSDYYRLVLVFGIVLSLIAFGLNLLLIPSFGIMGAAVASFSAFFIYNTTKIIIVLKKFKIQPFTVKTWSILGFTAVLTLFFYYWDFPFYPIISIALKSILVTAIYLFVMLKFNFSEDINQIIKKYISW
ncbi:MAG: polysaccharide biosynthesis C-terminal domain-containing protein [Gillisia sp.]